MPILVHGHKGQAPSHGQISLSRINFSDEKKQTNYTMSWILVFLVRSVSDLQPLSLSHILPPPLPPPLSFPLPHPLPSPFLSPLPPIGARRPFGSRTFYTQEFVIVYDNYSKKQIVRQFTYHVWLDLEKSRIRETPTLSTDADSRTDTNLKRLRDLSKT